MPGGTAADADLHARTPKLHVRQCGWKGPEMAPAHRLLGERRRIGCFKSGMACVAVMPPIGLSAQKHLPNPEVPS
jgi:hypothetical protein